MRNLPLLALVVDSLHPDKVDDTTELILDSYRDLDGSGGDAELVANLLDDTPRVRAGPVDSIGEYSLNSLSPDRRRTGPSC
jgi:hypothetical protein